mgnify:CR=1 FL=1
MRMTYATKRKLLGFTFLIPFLLGFFMFFAKPLFETFKYSFNKITIDEVGNMVFNPVGIQNYIDLFTIEVSTNNTQILRVLADENTNMLIDAPLITLLALFLALLELLKLGETHIEQEGIYGEIVLYPGRREDTPEEDA